MTADSASGSPSIPCPACQADLTPGVSICPSCGADIAMAPDEGTVIHWTRILPVPIFLVLAVVALVLATARFRALGPGPDLPTTLTWMLVGDGQRRPTLATLARAYETSRAMLRCCLDTNELCPVPSGDWKELASYANAAWRGYVPLVMWAAPHDQIEGRLAMMLDVDGRDGWGRPWEASLAQVPGEPPAGFYPDAVNAGSPLPADQPLLRLDLRSAGADGSHGTADDIAFSALFPAPGPIHGSAGGLTRRYRDIERARVWLHWQGTERDLIDARVLAEWYLVH